MTNENDKVRAAILRLQSSALECYQSIKDRNASAYQEGDVDFITHQIMRLANLEGGLMTLKQYASDIRAHKQALTVENMRAILDAHESDDSPTEEQKPPQQDRENKEKIDLEKRSPTYRRNLKKKDKKDESEG